LALWLFTRSGNTEESLMLATIQAHHHLDPGRAVVLDLTLELRRRLSPLPPSAQLLLFIDIITAINLKRPLPQSNTTALQTAAILKVPVGDVASLTLQEMLLLSQPPPAWPIMN